MELKTALLATLCVLFLSQLSEAKEVVKGNKNVVTREIQIRDYEKVEMVGKMQVVYEQSDAAPYFEITVDDNILPYLKIEVKGKRLVVEPKSNDKVEIQPTIYKIKTNSKKLVSGSFIGPGKFELNNINESNQLKLEVVGSGQVLVNNPEGKSLKMEVTGSGSIETKNMTMNEVEGQVVGSGKMILRGTASKGNFEVAGSGKIQAEKCVFKEAKTDISGSGSIAVHVTESLKGEITGSGKVFYKGEPSIYTNTVGSGKIKRID